MSAKVIKASEYIAENKSKVKSCYRNKYHVMTPIGWMNDPNGFNYAFGKYHLFYQYHPYSAEWGPMHWGHCTSDDFIVWKYEPVAMAPDMQYDADGCFSGSSIFNDGKLYLMYTSVSANRQQQALAVSSDGIKFDKLGVVIGSGQIPEDITKTDFRDPKIFTRNGRYYCLVGATDNEGKGRILAYRSDNLTDWEYIGNVLQDDRTNVCECPDYFVLDGKEVLIYSPQFLAAEGIKYQNQHSNIYSFGKLDYETGTFEKQVEGEIDSGFDFYAAQTLQTNDGRRILIAWMAMWDRTPVTKSHSWSGAMTLPRELSIEDNKFIQRPVREIEKYRSLHYNVENQPINDKFPLPVFSATQEIIATFDTGTAKKVGLKLFCKGKCETLVYYDCDKDLVVFDRSASGVNIEGGNNEKNACVRYGKADIKNGLLSLRLFLDVSSCEVFFGKGECVMTANVYSERNGSLNYAFVEGGSAIIQRLDVYNLEINKNFLEDK